MRTWAFSAKPSASHFLAVTRSINLHAATLLDLAKLHYCCMNRKGGEKKTAVLEQCMNINTLYFLLSNNYFMIDQHHTQDILKLALSGFAVCCFCSEDISTKTGGKKNLYIICLRLILTYKIKQQCSQMLR